MAEGERHPLPSSGESRHDEIPEGIAEEKGAGKDQAGPVRPDAVNPDGEPYPR
jgi:hypothetical protein